MTITTFLYIIWIIESRASCIGTHVQLIQIKLVSSFAPRSYTVHCLLNPHIILAKLRLNLVFYYFLASNWACPRTKLSPGIDFISLIQSICMAISSRLAHRINAVIIGTIAMELSINIGLLFLMETRLFDVWLVHRLIELINLTRLVLIIAANRVTHTPVSTLLTKLCLRYRLLANSWDAYWCVLEDAIYCLLIYWWVEKVSSSHHHLVLVLTLGNKSHYIWSLSLIYKIK